MEPNFGWLPRERGIEEESRRSTGAGPAASHHSPLDIQAFLLHTVPCTIQTLRFPFSPKRQSGGGGRGGCEETRKEKQSYGPEEMCALFFREEGWQGKWKVGSDACW